VNIPVRNAIVRYNRTESVS